MPDATTLIPLTLDEETDHTYSRVAHALGLETATLLHRLLTELAPVVARAGDAVGRDAEDRPPLPLHLYARLLRGEVLVGAEAMCPLCPAPDAATE